MKKNDVALLVLCTVAGGMQVAALAAPPRPITWLEAFVSGVFLVFNTGQVVRLSLLLGDK